jgi:hypothetical protein
MTTVGLGVSFSLHRCAELGVDPRRLLRHALIDLGCRRFRLMSYWNLHEPNLGEYTFRDLDWQLNTITKYGGSASLCLGKRQPRWPECHMPSWALELPQDEWYEALYRYLKLVVLRYKNHPALESWQLENEALLKTFGVCRDGDYNRSRLRREARSVRSLDPNHPLIMTLSDSWGLPLRRPRPDRYALTIYRQTVGPAGEIVRNKRPAAFYWLRGNLIRLLTRRSVFIHELQAEPWTNSPLLDTPTHKQLDLFNEDTLRQNVRYAQATRLDPIYLWGLEWWYWLKTKQRNPALWEAAGQLIWQSNTK